MSTKKKRPSPFIIHDKYFTEAKKAWYRARSVFKLIEIQEKFNLIKNWQNVMDIWAAPGSFLQLINKIIWQNSLLVWIDIQKINPIWSWNIVLIQESIFEYEKLKKIVESHWVEKFDLITSDIAPATTGQTWVDQYRSVELNLAILDFADTFLKKWWNLLLKVFVWEDVRDLINPIKKKYKDLKMFKPKACRDRSFEEYFICLWKLD